MNKTMGTLFYHSVGCYCWEYANFVMFYRLYIWICKIIYSINYRKKLTNLNSDNNVSTWPQSPKSSKLYKIIRIISFIRSQLSCRNSWRLRYKYRITIWCLYQRYTEIWWNSNKSCQKCQWGVSGGVFYYGFLSWICGELYVWEWSREENYCTSWYWVE